jgi:hypothetical protein
MLLRSRTGCSARRDWLSGTRLSGGALELAPMLLHAARARSLMGVRIGALRARESIVLGERHGVGRLTRSLGCCRPHRARGPAH